MFQKVHFLYLINLTILYHFILKHILIHFYIIPLYINQYLLYLLFNLQIFKSIRKVTSQHYHFLIQIQILIINNCLIQNNISLKLTSWNSIFLLMFVIYINASEKKKSQYNEKSMKNRKWIYVKLCSRGGAIKKYEVGLVIHYLAKFYSINKFGCNKI